ncbi:MAG: glycoside hydrolase/phage tail family protein, partial [Paracoccaceae bacterium]|nr:glycoside hydrolase/phage tail family protein [Paracoccaceae bacterium]
MATLVLSAVGASVGSAIGGSVLGLGSAVVGRAVGATLGRLIDQRLLGSGADAVPTGRIERIHLNGASEGGAVGTSYGRIRLGGQVIWASRFTERVVTSGTGKGTARRASSHYAYSVSLAIALGEGVVDRIARIWADGVEISRDSLNWRLYPGNEIQLPDPKIEAVEGAGQAPAYRGTAYVVIEDLDLGPFGNRVPQFSFEVLRRARPGGVTSDPAELIRGVALIPGTGEYALATTPVHFNEGPGANRAVNLHVPGGQSDFSASLDDLREEAPKVGSVSLVVSWFGDDLRCGSCQVLPKVEQNAQDAANMAWEVSGTARRQAETVSLDADGRPVFGGTPADESVIEAIRAIHAGGQEVMFYPFLLMDIQQGNGLTDPWSGATDQPAIPWRGRITLSVAPGRDGSPDGTAAADAEVAVFFGQAAPGDFVPAGTGVAYTGPAEWSYRRMILHYAHLCALAGGVESFCIGSELRGLTRIRGASGFAVVAALRALAGDVRAILGPDVRIGYAADWSEYFGYRPEDGSGDVYFNLDPLWADQNIDFIGIDNYMPLADWRDGDDHLDAKVAESIYDLDYLKGNVAGGEGFDWYYASDQARKFQIRTPIRDSAHGEDWIFRVKDLRSWWTQEHHERIGGVRQANPTAWVPESKPIWFTELGCAAIDKGANQPNAFWDAKSSESQLPYFSDGTRDDYMQAQYLRAMYGYWNDAANNPLSTVYGGPMVDMDHGHVWCWDARPWPAFPGRADVWSDGQNYARGHWLNGRLGAQALADVVAEICMQAGVSAVDVSGLHGVVRGYRRAGLDSARAALQPLMLAHGLDAVEEDGVMRFSNRAGRVRHVLDPGRLVWQGSDPRIEASRAPEAEMAGKVQLNYLRADGAYEAGAAEAILPDEEARAVSRSEMPLVLSPGEAQAVVERWLAEARTGRE